MNMELHPWLPEGLEQELDHVLTQGGCRACYVNYTVQSDFTARMDWSLMIENGDVIRIAQALVDRIAAKAAGAEGKQIANLHLPGVAYTGTVVFRPGHESLRSGKNGLYTTFTGPLRLDNTAGNDIIYIQDIDFAGSIGGVGLPVPERTWAVNCTFTNWKIGFLGYGTTWWLLFQYPGVRQQSNIRA